MFTQGLITDLIRSHPGGHEWSIALCDTDEQVLKDVTRMVQKMYLRYLCSNEFQTLNMTEYNQVPSSQSVSKELATDFSAPDFGGQNLMAIYDEINAGISNVVPDKYTTTLKNLFVKHAGDGIKNGLSNEEIVANFESEAKDLYPEIEGL